MLQLLTSDDVVALGTSENEVAWNTVFPRSITFNVHLFTLFLPLLRYPEESGRPSCSHVISVKPTWGDTSHLSTTDPPSFAGVSCRAVWEIALSSTEAKKSVKLSVITNNYIIRAFARSSAHVITRCIKKYAIPWGYKLCIFQLSLKLVQLTWLKNKHPNFRIYNKVWDVIWCDTQVYLKSSSIFSTRYDLRYRYSQRHYVYK